MKPWFERLVLIGLLGAPFCLGQGYNLVEVQIGSSNSNLEVAFGPKMPPEKTAGDRKNWSVRSFNRASGAVADIAVNSVVVFAAQKGVALTLDREVDFAKEKIVITFLQGNFPTVTSADPKKSGPAKKFAPAKGSSDADVYVAGAVTAGVGAKPNYTLETKAGYLFGLGEDGKYGSLGPTSELALDESVSSDPNHIKASAAYDKVFPLSPSTGWIFHSNFIGGEFDRKGSTKNLVSDLSMRLILPSVRLDTHTFVTADLLAGFEGGKRYEVPKGGALGSFDRKVLGANGYYLMLNPGPLDRISLTGQYVLRLPSTHEPFVPGGEKDPIFTTKPRHHVGVDLNLMLSKAFGITAQYRWGSLPPLFAFVDHKVIVGLTLQLKQAN